MHRALFLVLTASAVLNALLDQSISIRGVLRCRTVPLKNSKVALFEKRTCKSLIFTVLLSRFPHNSFF
ncbi:hypothetical protein Y032_0010g963 [Ancylostoma ceylanicum]|uniref:Secreted protein n=1 Tax=Ancylostoma ceylanicum TaxID=53326 RepID=A0A016VH78_9BILA|nr:hypothetical protein Y032_0010g963 [Ancylostoma ceylanicum]